MTNKNMGQSEIVVLAGGINTQFGAVKSAVGIWEGLMDEMAVELAFRRGVRFY